MQQKLSKMVQLRYLTRFEFLKIVHESLQFTKEDMKIAMGNNREVMKKLLDDWQIAGENDF